MSKIEVKRQALTSLLRSQTANPFLTSTDFTQCYFGDFEKIRFCEALCEGLFRAQDKGTSIGFCAELLMASEIIRDDILDGDLIRGGRPCLHITYGVDGAIAIADEIVELALWLAFQVSPQAGRRMRRALAMIRKGQVDSIYRGFAYPSPKEVIRTARYRAGYLMKNAFACLLPQDMASDHRSAVMMAGMRIGTCFQLRNDLQNIDSRANTDSSRYLSDLTQGQINIVIAYALDGSADPHGDLTDLIELAKKIQSNPEDFDFLSSHELLVRGASKTGQLLNKYAIEAATHLASLAPTYELHDVIDLCIEIVA